MLGPWSALRPSVPARHDEKPCTPACTVRPLWCFGVSRQQLGEMVQKSAQFLTFKTGLHLHGPSIRHSFSPAADPQGSAGWGTILLAAASAGAISDTHSRHCALMRAWRLKLSKDPMASGRRTCWCTASTILLWLLISQWCILYNLRLIWRRCALGNWHARRRIPRSVLACPLVVAKVGPFALVSWRRWVLGAAEPRI